MQGKSGKGAYTVLGISTIIALLILLVFWLTTTDLFTSDKDLLVREAGKVTISEFAKECKYYSVQDLEANIKELKKEPCAYRGILEKIDTNTFGDCTAYIRVSVSAEELGNADTSKYLKTNDGKYYFHYVKVNLKEKSDIYGALKDKVDVYGYINKLTSVDGIVAIEVDGDTIRRIDQDKSSN